MALLINDLRLDTVTHDLKIENFDLSIVSGTDVISQRLKIRLEFFRGEWFLDTTVGVPFYEDILVKNPDIPNIETILKAEILDTPGVVELLAFESSFDAQARKLTVTFTVSTDYGTVTITETL